MRSLKKLLIGVGVLVALVLAHSIGYYGQDMINWCLDARRMVNAKPYQPGEFPSAVRWRDQDAEEQRITARYYEQ